MPDDAISRNAKRTSIARPERIQEKIYIKTLVNTSILLLWYFFL
jgi:hypothetical protein